MCSIWSSSSTLYWEMNKPSRWQADSFVSLLAVLWVVSLSSADPFDRPLIHPQIEKLGVRGEGQIHAWIYFTDKGPGDATGAAGDDRGKYLSQRALQRRSRIGLAEIGTSWDVPLNDDYIEQVLRVGATLRKESRWLNAVSVSSTLGNLTLIAKLSFVERIDPVLVSRRPLPIGEDFPAARQRTSQRKELEASDSLNYGASREQIEQINAHLVHEAGYSGAGVLVLMLDTGYLKGHESIAEERIVAEWDFVNDDDDTQNEVNDSPSQHNHGTYTYSALGGFSPGSLIGPAYGVQFLLAKTEIVDQEIEAEEDNYVAGLEWGERLGADIASSSLGYLDWYTYADMDGNTAVTTRAVDIAVSLGMICVTAAGNEARSDWRYIIAPADADSVLAVGAVDADGEIARFSSRGPTFDNRIKPEVCARGVNTLCASPVGDSIYTSVGGTSLATPLVSGAAALILEAHPDWTPMMVREALLRTASQANSANNTYGWGIVDVWAAINYASFTGEPDPTIPEDFFLSENYPNPFNASTTIRYGLPQENEVVLSVYDLLGRKVVDLWSGRKAMGIHTLNWTPKEESSGIYFITLSVPDGGYLETRKMILLR